MQPALTTATLLLSLLLTSFSNLGATEEQLSVTTEEQESSFAEKKKEEASEASLGMNYNISEESNAVAINPRDIGIYAPNYNDYNTARSIQIIEGLGCRPDLISINSSQADQTIQRECYLPTLPYHAPHLFDVDQALIANEFYV